MLTVRFSDLSSCESSGKSSNYFLSRFLFFSRFICYSLARSLARMASRARDGDFATRVCRNRQVAHASGLQECPARQDERRMSRNVTPLVCRRYVCRRAFAYLRDTVRTILSRFICHRLYIPLAELFICCADANSKFKQLRSRRLREVEEKEEEKEQEEKEEATAATPGVN